jgi:hypothetical protein
MGCDGNCGSDVLRLGVGFGDRGNNLCLATKEFFFLRFLQNAFWLAKRNRDRISEIINFLERNMLELDEAAGEDAEPGEA